MITDVTHSTRISAAKRSAECYIRRSRYTAPLVAQMLEREVSKLLIESQANFPPSTVTALRNLAESLFRQGFETGCRAGMSMR